MPKHTFTCYVEMGAPLNDIIRWSNDDEEWEHGKRELMRGEVVAANEPVGTLQRRIQVTVKEVPRGRKAK